MLTQTYKVNLMLVCRSKSCKLPGARVLACLLLFALAVTASVAWSNPYNDANNADVTKWLRGNGKSSFGLLNPSKLSVDHLVSFGAGFGGDRSLMNSLYAANFTYRLSNPVTLNLIVGAQNFRYNGGPLNNDQSSLLGGFRLDYRPSENFYLRFELYRGPQTNYSLYSPYTPLGVVSAER